MQRPTPEALADALVRIGRGPEHFSEPDIQLVVHEAGCVAVQWIHFYVWRGHYVDWSEVGNGFTVVADLFSGSPSYPRLRRYLEPLAQAEKPDREHLVRVFRAVVHRFASNWFKAYIRRTNESQGNIRRIIVAEAKKNGLSHVGPRLYFGPARPQAGEPISGCEHVDELRALREDTCSVNDLLGATRRILRRHPECAPWIEIRQLVVDYLEFFAFKKLGALSSEHAENPGFQVDLRTMVRFWSQHREEVREWFLATCRSVCREDSERVFDAYDDSLRVLFETGDRGPLWEFLAARMPGITSEGFRTSPYRRMMNRLRNEIWRLFTQKFGPEFGFDPE